MLHTWLVFHTLEGFSTARRFESRARLHNNSSVTHMVGVRRWCIIALCCALDGDGNNNKTELLRCGSCEHSAGRVYARVLMLYLRSTGWLLEKVHKEQIGEMWGEIRQPFVAVVIIVDVMIRGHKRIFHVLGRKARFSRRCTGN